MVKEENGRIAIHLKTGLIGTPLKCSLSLGVENRKETIAIFYVLCHKWWNAVLKTSKSLSENIGKTRD